MHNADMTDNHQPDDPRARRREQMRLAQQRRRERLAQGSKSQVNVFLSKDAIARLDALALLWGVERQEVIERLLVNLELQARAQVGELEKPQAPQA
jgi:hypothetical protein